MWPWSIFTDRFQLLLVPQIRWRALHQVDRLSPPMSQTLHMCISTYRRTERQGSNLIRTAHIIKTCTQEPPLHTKPTYYRTEIRLTTTINQPPTRNGSAGKTRRPGTATAVAFLSCLYVFDFTRLVHAHASHMDIFPKKSHFSRFLISVYTCYIDHSICILFCLSFCSTQPVGMQCISFGSDV